MGCDRVPDASSLGFGGVRASMERRWLINAKITVLRQRKWQEVRLQKELDEQKMKADILERRKRERARLAAYIHSSVQPSVKCVTNGIAQRNNKKRLNWNACLLRDQELILKLRENVKAVACNYHSKGECSNSDRANQSRYMSRTACRDTGTPKHPPDPVISSRSGAQNFLLKTDDRDSDQPLQVPTNCADAVALNHLIKRDSHGAYQMLQLPGTRPVRCEIAINTSATWAPNMMPSEAKLADGPQNPSMLGIGKCFHVNSNASKLDSSVPPNLEEAKPHVLTKVAGCAELVETNAELALVEIDTCGKRESIVKRSSCDLKEEILKSRLANEAATTRLIAEVTAIESRLEDCYSNLKSLGIREDQDGVFPDSGPTGILHADACASRCDLFTETDHLPFDREKGHKNASIAPVANMKTGEKENASLEWKEPSQHAHELRVLLSSPPSENDIAIDTTILGSSTSSGPAGIRYGTQGQNGMEGSQAYEQAYRKIALFSFPNQVSSGDGGTTGSLSKKFTNIGLVEERKIRPENTPNCSEHEERREVFMISDALPFDTIDESSRNAYEKSLKDSLTASGNSLDMVPMNASSGEVMAESCAAWKIDWDAVTDHFSEQNPEYLQSLQSGYFPGLSDMDGITVGYMQGSHHSSLSPYGYEPRPKVSQKPPLLLKLRRGRPECPHRQGCDDCRPSEVEGRRCRRNYLACETSGLTQNSPDIEAGHFLVDEYTCQDANWAQCVGAPLILQNNIKYEHPGPFVEYSTGDEENHSEAQKKSIIEEEQKIFASLERLDWKLAAISLRSRNIGRESTVSQGQYSTKSAPTGMGPLPSTVMEHFSMSGKKAIPYSAIPLRPLTPQGGPTLRMLTGRQRRLVGLTNKAGRVHKLDRKKSAV